jgi:2-oxoglutarate dehydrogenase E2 component (dihydrolipoamide succinyltransferase)
MATEIRVPTLGESVTEATIGKWFKKVGDAIAIDEPLVELETDKVTVEVPAAAAGVLVEIVAKEGDTVEVNALLGQISGEGAAAAPAPKKEEAKPAAAPAAAAPVASASSGPAMQPAPAASKLLAESGLSADQVEGSGKRGQVLKGDVLDAIAKGVSAAPAPVAAAAARPASSADDAPREERVKMTRLRQTIAKRLKDAQNTAAMLTTYNEVDMSAVMELRT